LSRDSGREGDYGSLRAGGSFCNYRRVVMGLRVLLQAESTFGAGVAACEGCSLVFPRPARQPQTALLHLRERPQAPKLTLNFPPHLTRILIVSNAQENGLPQLPVTRPFVELHFDDDLRPHPMGLLVRVNLRRERR